ncbi:MAG: hypothetical protein RSC44_05385 [Clostridia bacterium]
MEADIFKVVYISCNPATLSRDIKMLLTAGYEVTYLQPFDMFPETSKIETLICLEKTGKSLK